MPVDLPRVYESLHDHYGPQGWWPARSRFEMAAGAILVQNTGWRNASLAISALRRRGWLRPQPLARAPLAEVRDAVRPAGFWRSKAARLQGFAAWLEAQGGFGTLGRLDTGSLRERLLAVAGIGPETADCILVYAFARPVFIADAYARRLFARMDPEAAGAGAGGYEPVRRWAESMLPPDAGMMGEFHALVVEHGKARCGATPRCGGCVLGRVCATGRAVTGRRSSGR